MPSSPPPHPIPLALSLPPFLTYGKHHLCRSLLYWFSRPFQREKCYSRDFWVVGRVRVSLKHDDGTPVRPDIPNRKVLMERVAEWVPKHPGRSKRAQAQAAQQQQKAQASGSGGGGGKSSKKGKKGKR